jgi:two-component sensor histidine kinase
MTSVWRRGSRPARRRWVAWGVVGALTWCAHSAGGQAAPADTARTPVPASAAATAAAEWYPATLDFGPGLVTIPVAWISPSSSDFWISYGAMHMDGPPSGFGTPSHWNGNVAIDTHWAQRFDVGLSVYSNNPEWGFFGQVLAVRDGEFVSFMPGIAIGARNLGPFPHEERFLIGTDVAADTGGQTHEETPSYFKGFKTAPTLYAVATKTIPINTKALSSVSLTIGGGDGLFSDNGGLGAAYDKSGTVVRGMFFGARTVTHPTTNTLVSLVAENDGWDWNAGVVGAWRGLSAALYVQELDKGGPVNAASLDLYNYRKVDIALGYSGNLHDVINGHVLRTQITQLQREEQTLRAEISHRQKYIVQLETRLTQLQQGEFGDVAKQRQELEQELQAERDAIERANQRLKQLQGGQSP